MNVKPKGNSFTAVLNDSNVASTADRMAHHQRPSIITLNISLLTNHTKGLETLLHFVQSSPTLTDVRLAGADPAATTSALITVVKRFILAIDKNPNIERLALYDVRFEAEALAKLLRTTSTLTHLSLTSCFLSKHDDFLSSVRTLQQAFRENSSLERLNLVYLEDRLLVPLLETMYNHTSLRVLDVSYASVSAASAMAQIIASPKAVFLEHVLIRNSSLLAFEPIVRSLRSNKSVRTLELVKCDIDAVSAALLKTLFRSSRQNIESLKLVDLDLEEDTNLEDILSGLAHCQALRTLQMHGLNIREQDLRALAMFVSAQDETSMVHVDLDKHVAQALKPFTVSHQIDRRIHNVFVKMAAGHNGRRHGAKDSRRRHHTL